ncbi:MAG: LysR family transcriptional regulator [Pseudomonadales bacterium]|nr:LysR family transcriptional regulator [Pseudomonadales bacterium]
MQNIQWDDYRVAYQVAQSGSLSKAAKHLQCNHATVLRHVNRLEQALNIKLFIRHQRGYRLTDAGHIMVSEMPNIFEEFNRLESLMGSVEQDISGNLRITTLAEFSSLLNPALIQFRAAYPKLRIQLISTDEIIPLASGAAHVSLRAGAEPQDPDLIVRKILCINMNYYAAESYVQTHGLPDNINELNQHAWVMPSADKQRIPYVKQILEHIDIEQVVYQSNHFMDIQAAVAAGMGIGLISELDAPNYPHLHKLELKDMAHLQMGNLWFVYHRDLKHNAKVKTLYQYLLEHLKHQPQNKR